MMEKDKLCLDHIRPVTDALAVLSGKWRVPILVALCEGDKRFNELQRDIKHITPRMLSRELLELEQHALITHETHPVSTLRTYRISSYGHSLEPVLVALKLWGDGHRTRFIGKS
ncbi:winged helix-turn-helix transcriptional regulator [Chitinophaga nivalis]|uniref:Helix-turn-helix transcriptional regulator n=1 Tax=Chitinophaga nivalis TaxID=2991709 RepID=A0ABT3ILJ7_9BACT|nr:helix-turn-helix domain-containing protein [Chitinophaga nivalis]MCW3465479.1 helix-turn-helix transcriptional regulator [Chitinophaga nivalis]MCW3484830.1 helix-turn-helix transcriptional regulator [Chitinophaga nivalis]